MNIFQTVKESVTARQAAGQYGFKVNRNGMICCPFHNDRHPSMKVDKGFCCFACGAKGDVITFAADLFHLSPLKAAKKLAEDFQIPITQEFHKKIHPRNKEVRKRTLYQTEKQLEQWERECICTLSEYLRLLEGWKKRYAPQNPDAEWAAEFVEACQRKELVEYYLDILLYGELQDRIEFLLDKGEEVKQIEKRMDEYRRKDTEKAGRGIG